MTSRGWLALKLALPDYEDAVTHCTQRENCCLVSSAIRGQLRRPKCAVSLRYRGFRTAHMGVPKAAMNEYCPTPSSIGNIGRAREISIVNAVAHADVA
jgi:hypothetical protein